MLHRKPCMGDALRLQFYCYVAPLQPRFTLVSFRLAFPAKSAVEGKADWNPVVASRDGEMPSFQDFSH